ncbi:hypothetical protein ESCO_003604 [Escovopsis weberi]|uniref:Uncharacterized protein n=1 Tax=Escovopsis weberi TaxID=150374 RepID=A0A0M9VXP6_ESCWE|nr:hypothetical protein ESCO_003604 [Escovopsis weberi]
MPMLAKDEEEEEGNPFSRPCSAPELGVEDIDEAPAPTSSSASVVESASAPAVLSAAAPAPVVVDVDVNVNVNVGMVSRWSYSTDARDTAERQSGSEANFVTDAVAEANRAQFGQRLMAMDLRGPEQDMVSTTTTTAQPDMETTTQDQESAEEGRESAEEAQESAEQGEESAGEDGSFQIDLEHFDHFDQMIDTTTPTVVSLNRWRRETRFYDGNIMHPAGMVASPSEVALAQQNQTNAQEEAELEAFRKFLEDHAVSSTETLHGQADNASITSVLDFPLELEQSIDDWNSEPEEPWEFQVEEPKPSKGSRVKNFFAKIRRAFSRAKGPRQIFGKIGSKGGKAAGFMQRVFQSIRGRRGDGSEHREDEEFQNVSSYGGDDFEYEYEDDDIYGLTNEHDNLAAPPLVLPRDGGGFGPHLAFNTDSREASPQAWGDGAGEEGSWSRQEDGSEVGLLPPSPPFDENFPQGDEVDDEDSYILPDYQDPLESDMQGYPLRCNMTPSPARFTGSVRAGDEASDDESAVTSYVDSLDSMDLHEIGHWEHEVSIHPMESVIIRRAVSEGQLWQRFASGGAEESEVDAIWTALHAPDAPIIAGTEARQAVNYYKNGKEFAEGMQAQMARIQDEVETRERKVEDLRGKLAKITEQVEIVLDNRPQPDARRDSIHRAMDWLLSDVSQSRFLQQQQMGRLVGRSSALADEEEFLGRSIRNQVFRVMPNAQTATEEQIQSVTDELTERAMRWPFSL